ncbi:MAG: phosphatase PAP2 family protein [Planctomycetaceae bacterium]|nr:phosphatase PAP2 family protein [Planctomycetaceae bacterium]
MFSLKSCLGFGDRSGSASYRKRRDWSCGTDVLEERRLLSADIVLEWNAIALDAVKNDYDVGEPHDQPGPTTASRALAIVHVAMFDTLNCFDHEYQEFLVDKDARKGASTQAAVAQAAHDTLVALFPHQTASFDAGLENSLQGIDQKALKRGTQLGGKVAQKILKKRMNDGSDNMMNYSPGDQPGEYRADPLHPDQSFITPKWGKVKTFVIKSSKQFLSDPPPELTSQEYTDAYNEVKAIGGDGVTTPTTRTAEQTEIGLFWGYDGSPGIGVPPRMYNQVTRVIAVQQNNSEMENARLFAMVNVALADAGISSWQTKFGYNFWRPVTAIRESDPGTGPTGLGDGNPNTVGDPDWTPLGAPADNGGGTNFTPAFPAYTSGHAAFGAAAFRTIANFYGTDDIAFSITSDEFNGVTKDQFGNTRPVVTRSFTSLSQAAEENGQSRIYLGIHWIFDKTAGIQQGTEVADYVAEHFAMPV